MIIKNIDILNFTTGLQELSTDEMKKIVGGAFVTYDGVRVTDNPRITVDNSIRITMNGNHNTLNNYCYK